MIWFPVWEFRRNFFPLQKKRFSVLKPTKIIFGEPKTQTLSKMFAYENWMVRNHFIAISKNINWWFSTFKIVEYSIEICLPANEIREEARPTIFDACECVEKHQRYPSSS